MLLFAVEASGDAYSDSFRVFIVVALASANIFVFAFDAVSAFADRYGVELTMAYVVEKVSLAASAERRASRGG